jgi:hypothetical protein
MSHNLASKVGFEAEETVLITETVCYRGGMELRLTSQFSIKHVAQSRIKIEITNFKCPPPPLKISR